MQQLLLQSTSHLKPILNFVTHRIVLMLLFGWSLCTNAQNWERRHQFAKSYVGLSDYIVPHQTSGYYMHPNGEAATFKRSGFMSTAIDIGATHFWGLADFYISINTIQSKFKKDALSNQLDFGTFTGLRIYPWALSDSKVRPFIGYKFSPFRYRQEYNTKNQFQYTQVKSVYDFGIGVLWKDLYITAAYNFLSKATFKKAISKNQFKSVAFPKHWFQMAVNYSFETTASTDNSSFKEANNYFSTTNRKGFFVALGPSSAFPLQASSYIKESKPFLDDKPMPNLFPDLAVGYHFTKSEIVTALSYRPMVQYRDAFDHLLTVHRKSLLLESYKFLFDYHGFAPYFGIGLSQEGIRVTSQSNGLNQKPVKAKQWATALVFGWDIRPSARGDWWLLRTNLRYFPTLKAKYQGKHLSLQHLEFNFIQFVWYPQKMKWFKSQ